MENSPTTSEHRLSPGKDLAKSPLVNSDGNTEEYVPELKLDDGKKAALDPMSIDKNEDGDHALTVDNAKCMGKYEYGTKP